MFAAVNALLQGFSLLFRPGLRRYTLAPVGISALILGPGLFWTLSQAALLTAAAVEWLPEWLSFLELVITPIIYIVVVMLGAWFFALLTMLVSGPFLGPLSARVEKLLTDESPTPGERGLIRDVGAAVGREMRKLGFYLPRALGALVLTFVPVLNGLSPVVWFALGAWMMAIQFLDFPQDNRGLPFQATRDLLGRHRIRTLCFGAMVATLLAIPLLGVLVLPAATIGATVLHVRHLRPARPVTP